MSKVLATAAVIGLLAFAPAQAQMAFHYNGPVETPEQNVMRSQHYDWLLEHNASFRAYREHKECGPIDFEQHLRQDCVQSFDQFEPFAFRR